MRWIIVFDCINFSVRFLFGEFVRFCFYGVFYRVIFFGFNFYFREELAKSKRREFWFREFEGVLDMGRGMGVF